MDKQLLLSESEKEMKKNIEWFKEEIKKIHTGRATPLIVENILVDYYGSKAPIKQIAAINIPEPRMIVIAPWNKDDLVNIEKAISESELKVNPQNDGEVIRVTLPSLTEERRVEMVKLLGKEKEKTRVAVRQIREEIWVKVKKLEEKGEISEDDKFILKDKLQNLIDKSNKEIDGIADKKEQEIMTV